MDPAADVRLRQMAVCFPGLVWLENPDTGRLHYLNFGFAKALGLHPDDLPATVAAWLVRVHPDDLSQLLASSAIPTSLVENTFRWRDFSETWRCITCRRLPITNSNGGVESIAGLVEDVTRLRVLEETVQTRSLSLDDPAQLRRKIARELHDGLGQDLADLSLTLARAEMHTPCGAVDLQLLLSDCRAKLDTCARNLRVYTHLEHPPLLGELGLVRALRHLTGGFSERTGIRVHFQAVADFPSLPPDVECAFYRIAQECLQNIYKHSGSLGASIRLSCAGDLVTLQVCDEGRGLPAGLLEQATNEGCLGVGLLGMRERMHLLGGQLQIESNSAGTSIAALLRLGQTLSTTPNHS